MLDILKTLLKTGIPFSVEGQTVTVDLYPGFYSNENVLVGLGFFRCSYGYRKEVI